MANDYLEKLRLFNRDVRLYLVTAALFGFTVFGGIYPVLLNLYLLRLGYGTEFIGVVNAALPLSTVIFSLPAGILGQRWSIRRAIITGLGVSLLGFGLLPISEFFTASWQAAWILASYLVGGIGIALYLVNANPFLMNHTSAEERSYVFSVQAALWPLAGFAGSLIGGLMPGFFARMMGLPLDSPAPYRYPLLIAAVALVPSFIAMLSTHDNDRMQAKAAKVETSTAPYAIIVLMALIVLLQVAGEFTIRTFFNVYLDVDLNLPTAQIGVLSAVGQLLAVPAALAAPLLMTRWGKVRTFILSSMGMVVCILPLALLPKWSAAGFGFIGMVALASVARPVITVYQQEIVAPIWQPAMSGATTMMAAFSMALMAFLGGYIIAATGYRNFFLIGAVLTLVGTLLFGITAPRHRRDALDSAGSDEPD